MFTTIKMFFGTSLGKNLLIGFAVALLLTAVYTKGRHSGYDDGHKDGLAAGVLSQKPIIDDLKSKVAALTTKINDDTIARNKKISELEQSLTDSTIEATKLQAENKAKRTQIFTAYTNTAKDLNTCGLDLDAINAINEMIDTQIDPPPPRIYVNPEPITMGEEK